MVFTHIMKRGTNTCRWPVALHFISITIQPPQGKLPLHNSNERIVFTYADEKRFERKKVNGEATDMRSADLHNKS